jgi:hypothetical protein
MAIIRNQQARKEAARQSLIQEYSLGADLDPRTKALADKLYRPVSGNIRSRLSKEDQQRRAYQANVDFIQKYSVPESMFAEAATAGADPRTIEALRKESDKAREEALKIRSMSGAPGFVGAMYSSRLRNIGATVGSVASQLQKQVSTEASVQPELQQIRRRRQTAAKQQASMLRRQTGRRALLSSPTGGAGFFGGYFKG